MANKDFTKLASKLATAFRYRILGELLANPKNRQLNHYFFLPIRQSLTQSFIIEAAKIFDDSKSQSNLTIYNFLEKDCHWSLKNKKTINSLKKFRNKYLAHNDLETSRNLEKVLKKIKLTPDDVMSLLGEAFLKMEALTKVDRKLHLGIYNMKSTKKLCVESYKDFVKKLNKS